MTKRVLIVDDEENIRRVTRLTLQAAGYEVGEAPDGERGLEAFGNGSTWDAVVLDQRMPGMDGLETLRQIKQRQSNARVIMSTAYASIELAVDAMKLGCNRFRAQTHDTRDPAECGGGIPRETVTAYRRFPRHLQKKIQVSR